MKKKIAIFAENLYGGGVERILQTILLHFDYNRFEVILYSSKKEALHHGFYPTGLKHYHYFSTVEGNSFCQLIGKINNKIRLFVYYHFSPVFFYRLFIRRKYDVGIAFIEGYATRILSGAPEGMKKIAWKHIELDTFHWTEVAFQSIDEEIACYKNLFKVACVSSIVQKQANQLFQLEGKSLVLYNPIDCDQILRLSKEEVEISLKKSALRRLISVGSLNSRKGYERLLSITKRLCDEGVAFELWILGKGEKQLDLEEYIQSNNLSNRVRLLGFQTNPYPYILNSDIYVCSSFAEGYNTAITEALVLGKAVVSTECSGVKEQLGEHNEYGICTPNTEEGLYEGLKLMLTGNNLAYYTHQAEIRGKDFSLEHSMDEIYRLIEE